MYKRIRDKVHNFRPQEVVNKETWDEIIKRYNEAVYFQKSALFVTLKTSLEEAESSILENRIREVQEVVTITKTFKRIFTTPKKTQDDEVVGQIKFIRNLMREVQGWIDHKSQLEKMETDGKIIIHRK
jgi:hypothetical protein